MGDKIHRLLQEAEIRLGSTDITQATRTDVSIIKDERQATPGRYSEQSNSRHGRSLSVRTVNTERRTLSKVGHPHTLFCT